MATSIRIAGSILAALALFGCAATPGNSSSKPTAAATVSKDLNCRNDNGSRIPGGTQDLCAVSRSYSQADIQRTGNANVGEGLAQLDPTITVHH